MDCERWGYDLDGVLAVNPEPNAARWGRMNGAERAARLAYLTEHYRTAALLYRPRQEAFTVITARKGRPEIKVITETWLAQYGFRVPVFFLTQARTIENV